MMYNYLQTIAIHGMRGKRRSMAYMFLVLFLSMTFVVVNVSISGSLQRTGEQLRYDTYGDWDIALFDSRDLANDQVWNDERILDYGVAQIYGSLLDEKGTPITCLGIPDDKLYKAGHFAVESGRFPKEANEIAMEADVLSQLGYDYQLGQAITLRVWNQEETEERWIEEESVVTREYILCGVIREYTNLWVSQWGKLAGAFLSPEGAAELGRPVSYQYFLQVGDEDPMAAARLCRLLARDYDEALVSPAGAVEEKTAEYHLFNLVLILLVTLVAITAIYSIQLRGQRRSIQLFRTIGATRKQLSVMIFFETIWMLVPAAFGGLGAGSLITWGILQILIRRNVSSFYISIPVGIILGMAVIWLGTVFLTRFAVFRCATRGGVLEGQVQKRSRHRKEGYRNQGKGLGLVLLSGILVLTGIFCYVESLLPLYRDQFWAKENSYRILADFENLMDEEYLEQIRNLPGVEKVEALIEITGALEFPGMEENPFCLQLAKEPGMTQSYLIPGEEFGTGVPFPKGIGSFVYGYSEELWEVLFQYSDTEIDREEFASGEAVILYLPYNTEKGIAHQGEVYQEFGIRAGDVVTITTYGIGEQKEDGSSHYPTLRGGQITYEKYEEPREAAKVTAKVAGIITTDILQKHGILASGYYSLLSSRAFADQLLKGEQDGVMLTDWYWTNQQPGYRIAFVYTGMGADFLSTDSVVAEAAANAGYQLDNFREEYAAYRQEEQQTLIQLWVSGACIFLVVFLVLMNLETLLGISRRRGYALRQIVGMSRRRLRLRILAEGGLLSLLACLLGHGGYLLLYVLREAVRYRRLLKEHGEMKPFWGWIQELIRGNLEMVNPLMHLAVCILCMLCVFLLFYCSQNRALKGNIRDQMQ